MAERTIEYGDGYTCAEAWDGTSAVTVTSSEPLSAVRRHTRRLRQELSARNVQRATSFAHEVTVSSSPLVIYAPDNSQTHGNFYPAAYRSILRNPAWAARLHKAYTASRRLPHSEARRRGELECASSSDALLMNVFCCPASRRSPALAALLSLPRVPLPEFGVRTRLPLVTGHDDRTELDMVLRDAAGDLLVEAKLTEGDFQTARPALMERYPRFPDTFAIDELPRVRGQFRSYQLLRLVLAAGAGSARLAVLLDARRPDLLQDVFEVYRAVRSVDLRSRLHVITWQEIAACVPRTLRQFLADKYGITPSGAAGKPRKLNSDDSYA